MTQAQRILKGSASWLHGPTSIGGALSGFLAVYYASLTVELPAGTKLQFGIICALVIAAIVVVSRLRALHSLRQLRTLESGEASPNAEALAQAVREVRRFPQFVFWADLQHWAFAVLAIVVLYKMAAPQVSYGLLVDILKVAAIFGPLSTVIVQPFCIPRTRVMIERLASLGLSSKQLLDAVPSSRSQLRARMVVFMAVTVMAPAIVTAELASKAAERAQERVLAAPRAERRALASGEYGKGVAELAVFLTMVLGVSLVVAYGVGSVVGRPMEQVAQQAKQIESGNVSGTGLVVAEDEIWVVSAAFNQLHAHLSQVIGQLQRAGIRIGSTTEQILATTSQYDGGAAEQASSLNETSAATEELARSARQIAQNAGEVSDLASKTMIAAREGRQSAEAFSKSTARMREDNQAISKSVVKLNKRVQQIGKIVTFINGIADKSDLLALNAELEGTKAGDVGRGFSLVAAEMRRLAENVLESTKEIELLIEEVRDATREAVAATDAGVNTTEAGMQVAHSVTVNLEEIASHAEHAFEAVRAISLATQQQQTGTDQLADAMMDILRLTQETLSASKEVQTVNVELASVSKALSGVVERFRVEEKG